MMEPTRMAAGRGIGPDLVVAGAARSGTSYLASLLGAHPQIDPCSVKEPNFFSREYAKGDGWYDALFDARRPDVRRMDASMSYTFPHFPKALDQLVAASPDAALVYVVREPLARALSHYQLHRDYFGNDKSTSFGQALEANPVYLGTSDYAHWLSSITATFLPERTLIVPFAVVTAKTESVVDRILSMIDVPAVTSSRAAADAHRNDVVQFRSGAVKYARRWVRRSGYYPRLRRAIGPQKMRGLRNAMTRRSDGESLVEALESCSSAQVAQLRSLYASARSAVVDVLSEQDGRLGLTWAADWTPGVPAEHPLLARATTENSHG